MRNTALSLLIGLLLMTVSPPLEASNADPDGPLLLTDFSSATTDMGWYVVNDTVMGGRSEGDFEQDTGELHFAGRTNTNGGGFSSIRTQPLQMDLSQHAGIRVRVKGDGRRYTWRLTTDARWRGRQVSYWANFETAADTWSTVDIPFSSFAPQFRGYQLEGFPLEPEKITGMGLMIYDNQDGPFALSISSVHAYAAAPFALGQYQWKKRVLVVSSPGNDDESLREQQTELAQTRGEFADRDMVLVSLRDEATSAAEGQELTAEEAARTRAVLGIRPGAFAIRLVGKDGSVKLSSETATSMNEIYALIDTMPMRQRENANR